MNFNLTDKMMLGELFLLSAAYALALDWWKQHYPESYDDLTWLQVAIGVGLVLLAALALLDLAAWLRIAAAFAVAGLPIVARSVINYSRRRRECNGHYEGGRDE